MIQDLRQRILRCRDLAQLDHWLVQAAQASSIAEITLES